MADTLSTRARQRTQASRVLFGICVAWIVTMISLQMFQAYQHGYGSGFGDGKRLPPEVVQRAGVGNDVAAAVKATTVAGSSSVLEDTVRLLGSVAALAVLVLFWYWMLSRLGSF